MKEKTKKVWSMDKTLVGTEESAVAVNRRCSVNKTFWKILENSRENTCAGVSFNEFSGVETCNFIKSDSSKGVLLWILRSF